MRPAGTAGLLLVSGVAAEWSGHDLTATILLWTALLVGGSTFVPGALCRLTHGRLGVGLLMTIAATGAVLLGRVGEAAMLAFLFSLAESLEDRAMIRAREGLRALLALIPDTVRVSRDDVVLMITPAEIRIGDVLIVGAGGRVATDGIIRDGASTLDTSAVTGESIPVDVGPGDPVSAGCVNGEGTLRIRATADGHDNSLTQIVELVRQAHSRKGRRARLADRIARPLVPGVLITATVVAGIGALAGDPARWIERALVILVAASPCALALAVPVTVVSAIGSASTFGVIIRSGEAFEQMGTVRTIAFDKTGTLTANRPVVIEVVPTGTFSREEVLERAGAVETTSSHPLAVAIRTVTPDAPPATDAVESAGRGVAGHVGDTRVRVGSSRWSDPGPLAPDAERMTRAGMSVVVVEVDGRIAGLIGVRDELRPEAAATVRLLHDQGVRSVMLSGDNRRTVRALAEHAGIDEVHAEQSPADKAAVIASLRNTTPVAMVGDGINDAPALATATVGIAMGLTGSAAAIESADVAFTGRDLRLIPGALAHARRGRRIMTTNIGLSLAIIVVLFPAALSGVLGLTGVVLVHELAEVVVVLNGLRAARPPRRISAATSV